MGGSDRCAVFGCKNERRHPERYVIKEHVHTLRFHSCRKEHFAKWTKLLNLVGYHVTASTRICSNHFQHGQPFPIDPHPCLFLKGYDHKGSKKKARKPPMKRPLDWKAGFKSKWKRLVSVGLQTNAKEIDAEANKAFQNDHNYLSQKCPHHHFSADYVSHLEEELHKLSRVIEDLKTNLRDAQTKIKDLESRVPHQSPT